MLTFKVDIPLDSYLDSKTPYNLWESCSWYLDLQLWYSLFGQVVFKILEKKWLEHSTSVTAKNQSASSPPAAGLAPASVPAPPEVSTSVPCSVPMPRAPRCSVPRCPEARAAVRARLEPP
jgi:hypothetical protein